MKSQEGDVVVGRTMDFPVDFDWDFIVYPRGYQFSNTAPTGKGGLSWACKYGFIGIGIKGYDSITDGLNETGLSVELLWLAETKYNELKDANLAKTTDIAYLASWILGNFSSVNEVKSAIKDIRVCGGLVKELNMFLPLHVAVHDAGGNNIVIEFVDGQTKIYDNPIGVMTNSPTFDWHISNLRNYVGLDPFTLNSITMSGETIQTMGSGSGLWGMPGDFCSPSRFVRLAYLNYFAEPAKTNEEQVVIAEHLLNSVDVPFGVEKEKDPQGNLVVYHTQWGVIKDLKNRVFYFRTYKDLSLKKVDLKKLNLVPGAKSKSALLNEGAVIIADTTENFIDIKQLN